MYRRVCVAAVVGALLSAGASSAALPWGRSMAGASQLPRPIGLGVTVYGQGQDYALSSLEFSAPGLGGLTVDPNRIAIDNQLKEANVKLDVWLFPFMNVFGLFGQLEGETHIDLAGAGLPIPVGNLNLDYDGDVYGGGVTLAYGTGRWFGSLTGIVTETNLSGDFESEVSAFVIQPRIGLVGDRGALWIGAMYQDAEEKHAGNINVPFVGPVDFDVELAEKDAWNLQLGMSLGLTEHWTLDLEGGAGSRDSSSMALTYRF